MDSIAFNIIFFIVGLFLIIKGGEYFVNSSVALAKKTQIPTVIIGATVVSIATTLPELIVSIIASANGDFGMAVGNGVGSIIANTALICGISMACLPIIVKKSSKTKYFILLFGCIFLVFASFNRLLDLYECILLLALFVFFMVFNIIEAKKETSKYPQEEDEDFIESQEEIITFKKIIPLFILGALAIAFGAMTLVDCASNLATIIGISQEFIGLTIVALGTCLPELVTTIISIRKKECALGYGNIIGANIINLTLLMGVSGLVSGNGGLPITKESMIINIPLVLIVTLIFILPLLFKSKTFRWQGILLLGIYLVYIVYLILTTLGVVSFF